MKINQETLINLLNTNTIFQKINQDFQSELLKTLGHDSFDLDLVNQVKVGSDFLKYLIRIKRILSETYFEDLLLFLILVAALNQRTEIIQSDLFLLTKVNIDVENWVAIVKKSLGITMFREFYLRIDQNGEFKDELTIAFENNEVTSYQASMTEENIKWLTAAIAGLEVSRDEARNFVQLNNHFAQEEIYNFYREEVRHLLKIMNFQMRAFKLIYAH